MPDSSPRTMSSGQQDSDGSANETPDRSLGSLSLTATGEQLDDIQVNLDRIYLESPAPSSLLQITQGQQSQPSNSVSGDVPGAGSTGADGNTIILSNNILRRGQQRQPMQTIAANTPTTCRPGGMQIVGQQESPTATTATVFDQDSFDRLSLIDLTEISETVESEDWLSEVPAALPANFSEEDRSFLDTNLLNKRFSLLNYVTRVINEEIYAESRRHSPSYAITSLGGDHASGSSTYRVPRAPAKSSPSGSVTARVSQPSPYTRAAYAGAMNNADSSTEHILSSTINEGSTSGNLDASCSPIENSDPEEEQPPKVEFSPPPAVDEEAARRASSGSLTYRRPPVQRQGNVSASDANLRSSAAFEQSREASSRPEEGAGESGFITGNYSNLGNRTVRLSNNRRRASGSSFGSHVDREDFIPDTVSPVGPAPSSRLGSIGARNGNSPLIEGVEQSHNDYDSGLAGALNRLQLHSEEDLANSGPNSREIDTRTYTRPKKNRTSLGTPNRQLNTTMDLSPSRHLNTGSPSRQHQALNTTMNLSHHSPGLLRTPNRQLNTTIDLPSDRDPLVGNGLGTPSPLNTTIDLPDRNDPSGAGGTPANLNETFVAESGDTPGNRQRATLTRNTSYVLPRRDEGSPNNNTSRPDLNSTFSFDGDGDQDLGVARGSQNTSMEDLNSRVARQIRSLGCNSRGRVSDQGIGRGALEDVRSVGRTSSTDTYSVAHSSESPTSSGLSSPLDAQSYDDIQTNDAVRRSMPNLAVIRGAHGMRSNLQFPQAGSGQLRKNHQYISDSRLSRLGSNNDRARLSIHPSESTHNASYNRSNNTLRPNDAGRQRSGDPERNTSTPASLNRAASGVVPSAARVLSASALSGPSNNSGSRTYRVDTSNRVPPTYTTTANARTTTTTGLAQPRYSAAPSTGTGIRPPPRIVGANAPQPTGASRSSSIPGIPVPGGHRSRIPAPGQFRFPTNRTAPRTGSTNNNTKPTSSSQKGRANDWRDGCY